jgi:UDP-N-acetylglucosamine:LPS N-acetylglucosamine transferase
MTRIALVYFDAGGGHRNAAMALEQAIKQLNQPWEIHLVNLQEMLDSLDIIRRLTGLRIQDAYNRMLQNGWTLGSPQLMRMLQALIWVYHGKTVRLLESYWREMKPDMVVSLIPHFNRALCESLRKARPGKPFVTILTDIADYPPHFWIEPFRAGVQEQFFICGTPKAAEQARVLGHPRDRVFPVSGMILRPRFYDPAADDRAAERTRLGLDLQRPTGLVLFGGQGSNVMLEIARKLPGTQLIFICGRNDKLAAALRGVPSSAPRHIEGFTSEIPYYMHLSDFFIGKPGPGSISEAVAMTLPVIVERNAWTLPQERYNVDWVLERNAGIALDNFRTIAPAVEEMLEKLDAFRANVEKIQNRAVFEIPDILRGILARSESGPPARAGRA